MENGFTIIEPGIGQWRSADIDANELPVALRFHENTAISPLEGIYDARVTKVDHALDMAFVDMGHGLSGSLNLRRAKQLVKGKVAGIADCVQEGQRLRVQVISEPASLEGKAVNVSARPRITGRYLVAESGGSRLNFSKDLPPRTLKLLKESLVPFANGAAIIVRSRAVDIPAEAVIAEAKRLTSVLSNPVGEPGLVFSWSEAERGLLTAPDSENPIFVEGGSHAAAVKKLAKDQWPDLLPRISAYSGKDAFEELGVNESIEEALSDRIDLPSGGWISITPTPAMTVVDVNMGGALKGMNAGEAKLVVNMEATLATAHHMQFQDIGGLVVVDYIDMSGKGHARELMQLIERTMRDDSVPVQHTGISTFGLVEFTRKRSGLSLKDRMQRQRPPVGRGAAIALELLKKAQVAGVRPEPGALVLAGPQGAQNWLAANTSLTEMLKTETQRTLVFEVQASPEVYLQND